MTHPRPGRYAQRTMKLCWFCGTETLIEGKIPRKEVCAKCKIALKCCKNCRFFDTSAPKQCRETAAEFVSDKDGANFCEYLEFVERESHGTGIQGDKSRNKFDSLFKK